MSASDPRRHLMMSRVGTVQVLLGDVAGAKKTMEALHPNDVRGRSGIAHGITLATAEAQARAGDAAGALQSVEMLPGGPGRAYSLIRVSVALAEAGNRAGAALALQRARQAAGEGEASRLAGAYAAIGDHQTAFKVADISGRLARAAGLPPLERAEALVTTARSMLWLANPTKERVLTPKEALKRVELPDWPIWLP